jgi:antagonist of KipI
MTDLIVVRPGMLTSVQDHGRHGFQHLGVPVGGPMDWWSYAAANRLVGNSAASAALEVTLIGPELEFTRSATAAVVGASFELSVSGRQVPMNRAFAVEAGARLSFGARQHGARAYLAIGGGIGVPEIMGSRATHIKGALGGFDGRALKRGDVVPLLDLEGTLQQAIAPPPHLPVEQPATLRAIEGPERCAGTFWDATFTISPQSDRMGYRLEGAAVAAPGDQLSSVVTMGTVQVTPSGTCVLLMADRATSGGYARAATVIHADLPIAGQLAPGDTLRFRRTTLDAARLASEKMRNALPREVRPERSRGADPERIRGA